MAGQAQGQLQNTDACVALRQGLRGTGEEKVAAKKPTGKGVLWFGGMAKNLTQTEILLHAMWVKHSTG